MELVFHLSYVKERVPVSPHFSLFSIITVIVLDEALAEFHTEVNKYWRDHENTTLSHITLVSSGGGDNDVQVREGLTPLDGVRL